MVQPEQATGDSAPVEAADSLDTAAAAFGGLDPLDDVPLDPNEEEEEPTEHGDEPEEAEAEPEAEPEPEAPAIEPPVSWSKEDKAVFQSLPPETQAIIARRETERDKFVQTKAQEAANTRQAVEREALQAIQKLQSAAAEKLQRYAQQFDAQEPDVRLLQTGSEEHRALFYQQEAAYRQNLAQRQAAQQDAQHAAQLAEQAEAQANAATAQQEQQLLQTQFPEWFDPVEGPKLQQNLQSIGLAIGYSPEQMREARATDILALKMTAEWKADSDAYRKLMQGKMATVRAAKQLPKVTRPGVAQAPGAGRAQAREDALTRLRSSGDLKDAAAAFAALS